MKEDKCTHVVSILGGGERPTELIRVIREHGMQSIHVGLQVCLLFFCLSFIHRLCGWFVQGANAIFQKQDIVREQLQHVLLLSVCVLLLLFS